MCIIYCSDYILAIASVGQAVNRPQPWSQQQTTRVPLPVPFAPVPQVTLAQKDNEEHKLEYNVHVVEMAI